MNNVLLCIVDINTLYWNVFDLDNWYISFMWLKYLDKNDYVISEPHQNLDKLVETNGLLKKDIELLIEQNKMYWGGDLDF